jgi:hypothetical protein
MVFIGVPQKMRANFSTLGEVDANTAGDDPSRAQTHRQPLIDIYIN